MKVYNACPHGYWELKEGNPPMCPCTMRVYKPEADDLPQNVMFISEETSNEFPDFDD